MSTIRYYTVTSAWDNFKNNPDVISLLIKDTALKVSDNLDHLQELVDAGLLTSITLSDKKPILKLTPDQIDSNSHVLELINGGLYSYHLITQTDFEPLAGVIVDNSSFYLVPGNIIDSYLTTETITPVINSKTWQGNYSDGTSVTLTGTFTKALYTISGANIVLPENNSSGFAAGTYQFTGNISIDPSGVNETKGTINQVSAIWTSTDPNTEANVVTTLFQKGSYALLPDKNGNLALLTNEIKVTQQTDTIINTLDITGNAKLVTNDEAGTVKYTGAISKIILSNNMGDSMNVAPKKGLAFNDSYDADIFANLPTENNSQYLPTGTKSLYVHDTIANALGNKLITAAIIEDTAAHVLSKLDALSALGSKLKSINLTDDVPAITVSGSQYNKSYAVFAKINSTFSFTINSPINIDAALVASQDSNISRFSVLDTATKVSKNIDALQSYLAGGQLDTLTLSDKTPILSLSAEQLTNDAEVLALINAGNYKYHLTHQADFSGIANVIGDVHQDLYDSLVPAITQYLASSINPPLVSNASWTETFDEGATTLALSVTNINAESYKITSASLSLGVDNSAGMTEGTYTLTGNVIVDTTGANDPSGTITQLNWISTDNATHLAVNGTFPLVADAQGDLRYAITEIKVIQVIDNITYTLDMIGNVQWVTHPDNSTSYTGSFNSILLSDSIGDSINIAPKSGLKFESAVFTALFNTDANDSNLFTVLPNLNVLTTGNKTLYANGTVATVLASKSLTGATIIDSVAHVLEKMDALQAMGNALEHINLTDAIPTITITGAQFSSDHSVLSKITDSYTLTIDGTITANAAIAASMNQNVSQVTVSDNATNVSSNLDAIETLSTNGQLAGLILTGTNPILTITESQLANYGDILTLINNSNYKYHLVTPIDFSLIANVIGSQQDFVSIPSQIINTYLIDVGVPSSTDTVWEETLGDGSVITLTGDFSKFDNYAITSLSIVLPNDNDLGAVASTYTFSGDLNLVPGSANLLSGIVTQISWTDGKTTETFNGSFPLNADDTGTIKYLFNEIKVTQAFSNGTIATLDLTGDAALSRDSNQVSTYTGSFTSITESDNMGSTVKNITPSNGLNFNEASYNALFDINGDDSNLFTVITGPSIFESGEKSIYVQGNVTTFLAAVATAKATGTAITGATIVDSVSHVTDKINDLNKNVDSILSISFTDSAPTLTITGVQYTDDSAVLSKITDSYSLIISGGIKASAAIIASQDPTVTQVGISDTANHISDHLEDIQLLADNGQLTSIDITSGSQLTLSSDQFLNSLFFVQDYITDKYTITIVDDSANIINHLDDLTNLKDLISTISFIDNNKDVPIVIPITALQVTYGDALLFSKINGNYIRDFIVNAGDSPASTTEPFMGESIVSYRANLDKIDYLSPSGDASVRLTVAADHESADIGDITIKNGVATFPLDSDIQPTLSAHVDAIEMALSSVTEVTVIEWQEGTNTMVLIDDVFNNSIELIQLVGVIPTGLTVDNVSPSITHV